MPRKAFMADLAAITQSKISCVSNIVKGAEDGEIEFTFTPISGLPITVTIISGDVSEYPGTGNPFYLSTTSHTAPEAVNKALEDHGDSSLGMTIEQLLLSLSKALQKAYSTGTQADPISLDDDGDIDMDNEPTHDDEECDIAEGEEYDDDSDSHYDPYDTQNLSDDGFENVSSKLDAKTEAKITGRIQQDLRTLKLAGFKVGVLSGMTAGANTSLLSISIRASKLGLSDEALQAWDLKKTQYVVLLIKYGYGYKSFDFIMANGVTKASNGIEFRVGLCNRYKPTRSEALVAFSDVKRRETSRTETGPDEDELPVPGGSVSGFLSLFISSSLNDFMNTQFIPMMKYREKLGVSWDGAKQIYNHQQNTICGDYPLEMPDAYFENDTPKDKVLPEIAQEDHLQGGSSERSFPLISMQFLLRYFIRCPEFCLICHDKTTETFEALKPYVCSKSLCLFQYMQLGFGPSIEHEIMTQPYVVDLLISFCYAAAISRRIRQYPLGQFILVPPKNRSDESRAPVSSALPGFRQSATVQSATVLAQPIPVQTSKVWDVKFDALKREVLFDSPDVERNAVNVHDWVVIDILGSEPVHYRVINVSLFPTIQLSDSGISRALPSHPLQPPRTEVTPATTPPSSVLVSARLSKYDRQFDLLDDNDKADSIVMLLDTLPKVNEMREYLCSESGTRLNNWTERITSSSLTLLRWIISSNRSIICQVDGVPGQTEQQLIDSGVRIEDKVTGMNDWMQFRFAQGAPDKEQRFVDSLGQARNRLKDPAYPTLFAWHGSAIHNWHSIIRSGLDYSETINGRAYGTGCYFSQDLSYSLSYTHRGGPEATWPGSELKMTSAFAMAEIVNLPDEFTSKNPHLVVQHVDWIQCRYLFVGKHNDYNSYAGVAGAAAAAAASMEQPTSKNGMIEYIEEDPQYRIKNAFRQPVSVPVHAIASRKAMVNPALRKTIKGTSPSSTKSVSQPEKKKRRSGLWGKQKELPEPEVLRYETDETDIDDLNFFTTEDEPKDIATSSKGKRKAASELSAAASVTDFVPGTLNPQSLQMMAQPSYATTIASMQLQRALKAALKTQNDTPPHELGWSIDHRFTDNLYQWIVELHSFDAELPLAHDMKKAEVKSVVLEIRFGKNYPISPPFLRVIRPRFLPFMSGGGGHVTAGGALCMELLTNSGWSAVNTIESVLMQVRLAISSTDPKPARLQSTAKDSQQDYGVGEAMDAYIRACAAHGWEVPSDFQDLKAGAMSSPGTSGYYGGV